jgi:hypothetical protein
MTTDDFLFNADYLYLSAFTFVFDRDAKTSSDIRNRLHLSDALALCAGVYSLCNV